MKKELAFVVAVCLEAGFAASVNYDVLGRRGSKMNSPMVYKDVDYSRAQKENPQKVGSELQNRALLKTGMASNVEAIEGAYRSKKNYSSSSMNLQHGKFYLRRYYTNGRVDSRCSNSKPYPCLYDWISYKDSANSVFIPVKEELVNVPSNNNNGCPDWTFSENSGYTFSHRNLYGRFSTNQPSPYESNQTINYYDFNYIRAYASQAYPVSNWYGDKASSVGIYMGVDALPVRLFSSWSPSIYCLRYNAEPGTYNSNPGYEVRDSRLAYFVNKMSNHPVMFVGKGMIDDPSSRTPQIYIGVRSNKMSSSGQNYYTPAAKELDNYIYEKRTVEFVPAGNNGLKNGYMTSMAHAANAITVGAVDPTTIEITHYTSTVNANGETRKPEIFNFSHFFTDEDQRTYVRNSTNQTYVYNPFYDGTEYAAAYTASMVSSLLAINPFYRWHPEVVKALMLTGGGMEIVAPYPLSVTKKVPSFKSFVFDDVGEKQFYDYYSRYWNGNINTLKTRVDPYGVKEIWFVANNMGSATEPVNAAITWLNSGNDIASAGKIPQDFDLYAYGSNNSNVYERLTNTYAKVTNQINFDNPGELLDVSASGSNSFEKVTFATSFRYIIFCIKLYSDDSVENRDQVVLGFNMSPDVDYDPYD